MRDVAPSTWSNLRICSTAASLSCRAASPEPLSGSLAKSMGTGTSRASTRGVGALGARGLGRKQRLHSCR